MSSGESKDAKPVPFPQTPRRIKTQTDTRKKKSLDLQVEHDIYNAVMAAFRRITTSINQPDFLNINNVV